jgi:hypothetical protein
VQVAFELASTFSDAAGVGKFGDLSVSGKSLQRFGEFHLVYC